MERQRAGTKKLITTEIKIGKNMFKLLNDEKLGRALDLIEGTREPERDDKGNLLSEGLAFQEIKKAFGDDKDKQALALYDRMGGGIRLGDRILKVGTFWSFAARKPIEKADLSEEDFGDEMVLVPKKTNKGKKRETTIERLKRMKKK